MCVLDLHFDADEGSSSSYPRRFPGDQEVLRYLEAFARRFDLYGLIRLETEVVSVRRSGNASWSVSYCSGKLAAGPNSGGELRDEEVFDAVVVCNGHFAEPRLGDIAGNASIHASHVTYCVCTRYWSVKLLVGIFMAMDRCSEMNDVQA